jgi:Ni,Fe-hydrogenase III large subunit
MTTRERQAVRTIPTSLAPTLEIRQLPAEEWPEFARTVKASEGATFLDLFAGPHSGDDVAITLLLSLHGGRWLALRDYRQRETGFPTLRDVLPAAEWYEREAFERYGIAALGNPHLLPLGFRPSGYAEELSEIVRLGAAPQGVVDYPLGPVRSGIVESGHYTLRTVGEEIIDAHVQLAYKHRGIEDMATAVDTLHLPLLAERISATDAVANAVAGTTALEQLASLEIPARAAVLRSIAGELERQYNHALYLADLCGATGLVVGQAQFEIAGERLHRLAAAVVGHRYLFGFVVPGGTSFDPNGEQIQMLRQGILQAQRTINELGRLARTSGSHMDRLLGTGVVTPFDAEALAVPGPVGRAAGFDQDSRRDHPYAAFRAGSVPVPVREMGDAAARMEIRLEEADIAADLALGLLERLPAGNAAVANRLAPLSLRPNAVGLGWAEGSRGTEVHWLETNAAGTLARYRVRSASFAGWQAFARSVPRGNILTDFPILEQSFGLSFAGADR